MELNDKNLATRWLSMVPEFAGVDPERVTFERLSSLTNVVFRVQVGAESFCLRIPGRGTKAFIDRDAEKDAVGLAAQLGLSPEIVHFDADTGLMVTRYIAGAVTMSRARFASDASAPSHAAQLLRRLHEQSMDFAVRFDAFGMIERYLAVIASKHVALPAFCGDALASLPRIRNTLLNTPRPLAPCHCDPICENFIEDGKRLWIVDWEYAGMNDPMWDLGDLSAEADFSPEQDDAMFLGYFGVEPSAADHGRVVVYKALSELLWGLWGFMREDASSSENDYRAYGDERMHRALTLLSDDSFGRHLSEIHR